MSDPVFDPKFESAERLCIRHWNEFLTDDPKLARIELKIAHASRLLVREYRGSAVYAEALKLWYFYRDARRTLLEERYRK